MHQPNDEWYTPLEIIRALGPFDLDPACGPLCDNATARRRYRSDGLARRWTGRVWLNPPFSNVAPWVDRMIAHRNGIMLVFCRSDAAWFQRAISAAAGVFLFRSRTEFQRPDGSRSKCPLGCCLIPFGARNRRAVLRAGFRGIWLPTVPANFTKAARAERRRGKTPSHTKERRNRD
ncbi:MAG: adenine methyltransferase [Patescibacteria group bacterium]|nr:adenine methyltransferase [Patescibacteria group bacterium]